MIMYLSNKFIFFKTISCILVDFKFECHQANMALLYDTLITIYSSFKHLGFSKKNF